MSVFAIPTLAGQAALAAALDGGPPITIAEMVVGDGNGHPITPVENMTNLVNIRATVPISTSVRVGNIVTFSGVVDENIGGFTIREYGLLDDDGILLFVGSLQATEKLTTAENTYDVLTLEMQVIISDTATVLLQPPPGSLVSIADMIRAPFITVDRADVSAPPSSPSNDATYLVPSGATGAWVGHDHSLAQWNGSAWVFKIVPVTHLVGVANTGLYLRRTSDGWRAFFADIDEHKAGTSETLGAHPRGVAAMIEAALEGHKSFPETEAFGVLVNDGAGNISWRGRPLFTGTGAPGTSTGMVGAMYLRTTTGHLYGPRVGESWGNPLPVPFDIAALPQLTTVTGHTRIAATDGTNNGKLTIEQINNSDYAHSEAFFLGMM